MKIINEGDSNMGNWWVGIVSTCPTCGRKVELEQDDERLASVVSVSGKRVVFHCSTCRERILILNHPKDQ